MVICFCEGRGESAAVESLKAGVAGVLSDSSSHNKHDMTCETADLNSGVSVGQVCKSPITGGLQPQSTRAIILQRLGASLSLIHLKQINSSLPDLCNVNDVLKRKFSCVRAGMHPKVARY